MIKWEETGYLKLKSVIVQKLNRWISDGGQQQKGIMGDSALG